MVNYHLVIYIESCNQKLKKFKTISSMNKFIEKFMKNRPNTDDYWIDLTITNINGKITKLYV